MKNNLIKLISPSIILSIVSVILLWVVLELTVNKYDISLQKDAYAQEVGTVTGTTFDFNVEYMGEIAGSVPGPTQTKTYNLDGYDYFIVKMKQRGAAPDAASPLVCPVGSHPSCGGYCSITACLAFIHFGPYPDLGYDRDYIIAGNTVVDVKNAGTTITVTPSTSWAWRVWRVKVNGDGFPEIEKSNFEMHNDDLQIYPENVSDGCVIKFMMLDDDPAAGSDLRRQYWKIQKEIGGVWTDQITYLSPDGMVVAGEFTVPDDIGTGARLALKAEDSINILHAEVCGSYSWQVLMKGVFIATGQREREGVGVSGFSFERDLVVAEGVAPLLISYDPKYLIEFTDLLGQALVDWVEVPN